MSGDEERLTPELQALLAAERDDHGPDAGARDRVARRLAQTLGVTLAAAGASASATSGAQAVLPKALAGKSIAAKLLVAALVGAVGVGGVTATVVMARRHARRAQQGAPVTEPALAPAVAPVVAPPAVAATATAPASGSLGAVSPSAAEPSAVDSPSVPAHRAQHHAHHGGARPGSVAEAVAPQDGLTAERALLTNARAAMQASEAPRALEILDDHARRFAHGQLVEERDALRVVALALGGDHDGARRHAAEFARRYPDSLFLPSVQRAVTERPGSSQ